MTDISGATKLFTELLDAEVVVTPGQEAEHVAELTWSNGARLRLVEPAGNTRTHLHFARLSADFSRSERSRAAELAERLGTSVHLRDN